MYRRKAESGLVNAVFLVDEKYVFRFPHDDEVYAEQLFEQDVCSYLARYADKLPFGVPKPSKLTVEQGFIYDYIPGATITEYDLLSLSKDTQITFIQDVLLFINWLGKTLSPERLQQIADSSKGHQIESWDAYIARTVAVFQDTDYPALTEVNSELMQKMKHFYPAGIAARADRVIHDDLHMGNLLFMDQKLSGVIDFGNIMTGDLTCELRHFYRLSPELARQACDIYESKYDQKVDYAKVAWWAKVNDAATLTDKILAGKQGSPSYERALTNLTKWYPEKIW